MVCQEAGFSVCKVCVCRMRIGICHMFIFCLFQHFTATCLPTLVKKKRKQAGCEYTALT